MHIRARPDRSSRQRRGGVVSSSARVSLPETDPRLCRAPFVTMMETADLREGDDPAPIWTLNHAAVRRIASQGQVAAGAVVVCPVGPKDPAQVLRVEHDDVIEAVAPDRADDAFGLWILPGGSSGGEYLANPEALDPTAESRPGDTVAVPE